MDNSQRKFLEEIKSLHDTIANQTTDLILTSTELSQTHKKATQLNFENHNMKNALDTIQTILESDKNKKTKLKAIQQLFKDYAEQLPF